jgi:hypothetical protein
MSEFFYRSGQNEYGPLTSSELRKLADAGRLAGAVEVRKGRSGRWIAAGSVQSLLSLAGHLDERAIHEMDIVTDSASLVPHDLQPAKASQQDTAVDSEARGSKQASLGRPDGPRLERSTADTKLVHWATAVAGMCYCASFFGAVMGILRLFGEQTLLHHIFIGICFLFALIGLAGGCGISLLLALRRR